MSPFWGYVHLPRIGMVIWALFRLRQEVEILSLSQSHQSLNTCMKALNIDKKITNCTV
jgi:hypothetical protein